MQSFFMILFLSATAALSIAAPVPAEVVGADEQAATAKAMPDAAVSNPVRALKITTWNLEHMMSEAVFGKWVEACKPYGWDDGAAREAGKPATCVRIDVASLGDQQVLSSFDRFFWSHPGLDSSSFFTDSRQAYEIEKGSLVPIYFLNRPLIHANG